MWVDKEELELLRNALNVYFAAVTAGPNKMWSEGQAYEIDRILIKIDELEIKLEQKGK